MTSLILQTASRFVHPALLMMSLFLLLRGHHEPGGGFSGGLVAAVAFALHAIAHGARETRDALRLPPQTLIGSGLLCALTAGIWALFAGRPLLTGAWRRWWIPGLGHVEMGTPLLFDIGVYLVVVGATLMIVLTLAEE